MPGKYTYPIEERASSLRLELNTVYHPPLLLAHIFELLAGDEDMFAILLLPCHYHLYSHILMWYILYVEYNLCGVTMAGTIY